MIITAFMPVRFFAETSTFSVSPSSRLPFETTVLPKSPRPQRPQDKDPTATVDKLRWESRA